ncbi:uncharacterized mitochondrial protein AtMg00810-like [Solanum stenotomum]|uniref:uncharacterized mitochondrial protein AtMg00810-like n=1 Tax=Solanum stenotomum TaxID=172797 RepID=UPI0020D0F463|nr:uncharacterized mitochondrial protein AtMg00810-like [Solanum stenotomum]
MRDLGELRFLLGIEFARSSKYILMHQRKYALELISETRLGNAKPAWTPIDNNNKLTSKHYDDYVNSEDDKEDPPADQSIYQRLIGNLLYLIMTRTNIAFGVQTLSQFLQQPKKTHMEAALRIVRYIKGQPGQGILLSSSQDNKLTTFCDADWASCSLTRKSITGYFIKFGNSVVSWKSKKQSTVPRIQQKLSTKL